MITQLAIAGYRSLRDVRLGLGPLNVVTGPNGSGKSSLYRALRLLADVAQGRIVSSLAQEGGLASTLWAGPENFSREMKSGQVPVQGTRRSQPVALKLGFAAEDYGYAIDLGLPAPSRSRFQHDPEIKVESVWTGPVLRRTNCIAERRGAIVRVRSEASGEWRESFGKISTHDSFMTHAADAKDGYELLLLRERMRGWRFYDELRTDRDAPARRPQIGTFTPVLSSDGGDLGSAIQTIFEVGEEADFEGAVDDAFPGMRVEVGSQFELRVHQPGLLRPLDSAELSDGTLRYLLLVAALLSPRPPELMILNEPERSLHPDLLGALARLIGRAAARCQIIVISHAGRLVAALEDQPECRSILLEKQLGETIIADGESVSWEWPSR